MVGRLAAAHAAADWKVLLSLMHGAGTGAWLKPQDMLGVRENVHTADLPEWSDKETQLACDAVKDAYECFRIAPPPMCSSAARATKQDSAAAGTAPAVYLACPAVRSAPLASLLASEPPVLLPIEKDMQCHLQHVFSSSSVRAT